MTKTQAKVIREMLRKEGIGAQTYAILIHKRTREALIRNGYVHIYEWRGEEMLKVSSYGIARLPRG